MSRPVNAEVELLFDVARPAGTGDEHQIRRFRSQPWVFVRPVGQSTMNQGDVEKGDVDVGNEAGQPWPARSMDQDEAPALRESGVGPGHTDVHIPIAEVVLDPTIGGHVMVDSLQSGSLQRRKDAGRR